jgi:phytoene desaturase
MDTRRPWCFGGNLWSEHAPKGKNIVRVVIFPESTTNWNPKREHEIFIQDLKEQFPKFEEYGGEILLARKWSGVWPYTRAWIGHCVSQKTPIENLYNVGDGACPPGWTCGPGAAQSARLVVDDIKARIGPR